MDVVAGLTNCKIHSRTLQSDNEQEWLEHRTKGIGGSDIGAICGVSEYSSARQIYFSKTGQYQDAIKEMNETSKEYMYFGRLLEPVVAFEYARREPANLCEANAIMSHKDYPWALANVDRLILDDNGTPIGVLECKTANEFMNKDWIEGDIPLSYLYQLQWYLWITDLQVGAFACIVGGNKFYSYTVYRNDELLNNTIIPQAKSFWFDNVLALKEPELSASDKELVNMLYSEVKKDSEIILDTDIANELAYTVVQCKQRIKELTGTMEEAQNRIKELLKDNELGYTRDYIIKWSPRSQMRVDTDKLKTLFYDVHNKVLKKIEFRVMTIKGV